jgi:transcriptional regulator with XRE-family HTH domain
MSLFKIRKANGLTQRQVAFQVGITERTYCRWESGVGKPHFEALQKLKEVLGAEVEEALMENKSKQEEQAP